MDSPQTGGLGHRPTPHGHYMDALHILMKRGEDLLGGGYKDAEAYHMQLDMETYPGMFAAEVRRSLLDLDDETPCGLGARAGEPSTTGRGERAHARTRERASALAGRTACWMAGRQPGWLDGWMAGRQAG